MGTILQALGVNKWVAYILLATALLAGIASAVGLIRKSGSDAERARQLRNGMNRIQKEALERARIESLRTADARKRLRDRWSSR